MRCSDHGANPQPGGRPATIEDLEARTLSVCQLHEGRWLELAVGEGDIARTAPFEDVPLALAEWWQPGAV